LGYFGRSTKKKLHEQTVYITDYSIEVKELYKLGVNDPLALKEALVVHLSKLLQKAHIDAKVFDLQIALSDTKFLDALETLSEHKRQLKLMEKRALKGDTTKLEKQYDRVEKVKEQVQDYKNSNTIATPVKAFITFTTPSAAHYIKNTYDKSCLRRWLPKYSKYK
jgi:hypothetical protein